jgi:outer membrane protein TolC
VAAVCAGAAMFRLIPQQFFPSAERNQFVIDVWMPQGSRIEATDDAMRRIERTLRAESQVAHFAAFVGQSAPRFYYNVNPQLPDTAYGQFIVNTRDEKETPRLVAELRRSLASTTPEALVIVKELQQGIIMQAPVEVRISGYEIGELQRLGRQVEDVIRAVPDAELVHNDYYNDSYRVDVDVNTEISNRLGLSNAIVSQTLSGGFSGAPVSTFWEGDRAVNIVLRLDPRYRRSFEDVRDTYLTSPITHASVPLRSVAGLEPTWQTSRIVRRSGIRTLTVRAFPVRGHLASGILNSVDPKLRALPLPAGYRMEYGGERTNTTETMPAMQSALAISLVAIFLVLLMQFRTLSDPLIVMCSIPLTLFGAMLGLVLTHYPFGFTAFTGLISLCGIVVRNSIILVDYIREKLQEGLSLEQAATEAGERRLRPIFLTTMAAAVGVSPMILSGSSLWGPLASVIAVGLVFSMFFTLLVVPVLYVVVKSRRGPSPAPAAVAILLALALCVPSAQAAARKLSLAEAVDLARRQNHALKIARAHVRERAEQTATARSNYFPQFSNSTSLVGLSAQQLVTVPAGSLGTIPPLGPFPPQSVTLQQGSNLTVLSITTVQQPLTQLWKIRQGVQVAAADQRVSEADLKKAEDEVAFGVHQLYYGLLVAQKQTGAVRAQMEASNESLREAQEAVRSGNALEVTVIGARAALLKSQQELLAAENQVSDLNAEMDAVLGLSQDTDLHLEDVDAAQGDRPPVEEYLRAALDHNAELRSAKEAAAKARSALSAARLEYVPDVGVFAREVYQNGVPFLTHNFGAFGLQMNWNIWDWGKRNGVVGERSALVTQAEENIRRITDRVTVDVEKAYRKLERMQLITGVAREALALQRESARIHGDQLKAGLISDATAAEAVASVRKAEVDELQARLAYSLALAEIEQITGVSTP